MNLSLDAAARRELPLGVTALLGFCLLVGLVYRFDAPPVLGLVVLLAAAMPLLFWPEIATYVTVFILYTNFAVLAYKYHGVPQWVAGSFLLLLLIPCASHLIVRREQLKIDIILTLMMLYLGMLLLSSFGAKDFSVAYDRVFTFLMEGLVLYLLIINVVRTLPSLRRVLTVVLFAGSLLSGLSVYQAVSGSHGFLLGGLAQRKFEVTIKDSERAGQREAVEVVKIASNDRARGPFDDPNKYAQILVVLLPFAVFGYRAAASRRSQLASAAAGFLIVAGILLSYSRGAFVTLLLLAGAFVFLKWMRPAHLLVPVFCCLLLIPVLAPEYLDRIATMSAIQSQVQNKTSAEADHAIRGRMTEMLAAYHVFRDHPIIGVGPGQYTPFYSVEYHQIPGIKFKELRTTRRAHSLYLEMAAELGLVGLTVFLALAAFLMRALWQAWHRERGRNPELSLLAMACCLSITTFFATSIFLHFSHERFYWFLVAVASATLHVCRSAERNDAATLELASLDRAA
jgi:putative inorganic carbon (hco3(-)) transporter